MGELEGGRAVERGAQRAHVLRRRLVRVRVRVKVRVRVRVRVRV